MNILVVLLDVEVSEELELSILMIDDDTVAADGDDLASEMSGQLTTVR